MNRPTTRDGTAELVSREKILRRERGQELTTSRIGNFTRLIHTLLLYVTTIHCRESADTGPVLLKEVPVTGAAFSGIAMNQFSCASLFPHHRLLLLLLLVCRYMPLHAVT